MKKESTIFEWGKAMILIGFIVLTGMFFAGYTTWWYYIVPFIILIEGLFIMIHKIDEDIKNTHYGLVKILASLSACVVGMISFGIVKLLKLLNKSNLTTILIVLWVIAGLIVFCWINSLIHKKIKEEGMF